MPASFVPRSFFWPLNARPALPKSLDQFSVRRIAEELGDAFGDARADFVDVLQFFDAGAGQGFHRSEMLGQELRRAFAHHPNSQSVDHSLQWQLLRIFDLVENVLRRLIGEALQAQQIFLREVINVGDILDQSFFNQLVDERFAHAVDIHDAARGEMQNRSQQFGGTIRIHAAVVDFALSADDFGPAHRALLRHDSTLLSRADDPCRRSPSPTFGMTSPPRSTCT